MSVRNFQSSLLFLQQYYAGRKSRQPSFSYEVWAKELGLKNRSYLRLVVVGQRPLNAQLIDKFSKFFQFNDEEVQYFTTLVHYAQSRTPAQRQVFARQLISLHPFPQDRIEVEQQFEFLSDVFLPRLQTICGFEDAPEKIEDLAEYCGLSPVEVEAKLNKLEELGLIKEGKPLKRNWKVMASHHSLGHQEFYRTTLREAESAMDLPFEERKFRSLLMALNKDDFLDFQKDFEQFVREQLQKRGDTKLTGRRLYQLNFNFFPVTPSVDKKV